MDVADLAGAFEGAVDVDLVVAAGNRRDVKVFDIEGGSIGIDFRNGAEQNAVYSQLLTGGYIETDIKGCISVKEVGPFTNQSLQLINGAFRIHIGHRSSAFRFNNLGCLSAPLRIQWI